MFQKRAMKRAAPFAALLLFACGDADQPNQQQKAAAAPPLEALPATGAAAEPLSLECATAGGEMVRACLVEQAVGEDGVTLTLRNPDGGFRRLLVSRQGEITAADGAEPAEVATLGDGRIEVTIGGDRYRMPAPAGPAAPPAR